MDFNSQNPCKFWKLYEFWPTNLGTNGKNYTFASSAIDAFIFFKYLAESHNKMDYSKNTVKL